MSLTKTLTFNLTATLTGTITSTETSEEAADNLLRNGTFNNDGEFWENLEENIDNWTFSSNSATIDASADSEESIFLRGELVAPLSIGQTYRLRMTCSISGTYESFDVSFHGNPAITDGEVDIEFTAATDDAYIQFGLSTSGAGPATITISNVVLTEL